MDGVLLIDKPAGVSSHDVVAAVRRALGGPRTGHAGTLDPFATGLLIVLVGRATKAQSVFMGLRKRYETVAQLGAVSSTGDPEGQIEVTGRLPPDPPALPVGEVRQRPPAYSAVKIAGERAYRRARRGERPTMPERIVTVHRFEQRWREPDPEIAGLERACFEIECGSGTYVRSLIADLHDAYCLQLRRTAIGPFELRDALAPPVLRRECRRRQPDDDNAREPHRHGRERCDDACAWQPRPIELARALALAGHQPDGARRQ